MAHSSGENAPRIWPIGADGFDGARGSLAQQVLELGEDLFDRVEVWRVFGQEEKLGTGRANELAYGFAFVTAEIVHDHDVTGMKRWDEDLFDIGLEALAIDGTVEQPWSVDPVMA